MKPKLWEYRYIKSLDELRDGEIFVSLEGTYHGHFAIGWAKRPVEDVPNGGAEKDIVPAERA